MQPAVTYLRKKIGLRCFAVVNDHPLYRSRQLNNLDDAGIQALKDLGIIDVYDLRKPTERQTCENASCAERAPFCLHVIKGDLQGDPQRTQRYRATDVADAYGAPGMRMVSLYSIMGRHGALLQQLVKELMHPQAPTLIHCVNGKDRTGVVSACVQRALGFDEKTITEDYLATNSLNAEMNKRDLASLSSRMSQDELSIMAAMFEARASYLQAFWNTIDEEYGSFEAFAG